LAGNQPEPIELAAVDSLNRFADPAIGPELIKLWNFSRVYKAGRLYIAGETGSGHGQAHAQNGSIEPNALDTTQAKFIRTHPDGVVNSPNRCSAQPSGQRQNVIDAFLPALNSVPMRRAAKNFIRNAVSPVIVSAVKATRSAPIW
jgi:hypothetical protein